MVYEAKWLAVSRASTGKTRPPYPKFAALLLCRRPASGA
jgi:hypothetical protein